MKLLFAGLAASLATLAAAQGGSDTLNLHHLMRDVVAKQADVLWDVGNRALDDNGNPDVSKLSEEDWTRLAGASQAMKDAAASLAGTSPVTVVAPGEKLQDEGAPGVASAKDIQGFIDSDPQAFADHARKLANVSDAFLDAAKTRDATKLWDASSRLDQVCEACHVEFWYPRH